jgi:hypothetical protein
MDGRSVVTSAGLTVRTHIAKRKRFKSGTTAQLTTSPTASKPTPTYVKQRRVS